MTRGRIALVCAVAGFTIVAFNAVEAIIYNCKPPVDPYFAEWCGPSRSTSLSILIGPWLVATFLLARREAIVLFGSGFTYGWFACVFMGLMWWLGFLAFFVLWLHEEETISELLRFAVVSGAITVPVIGFLTAVVGSVMQVFIRLHRKAAAACCLSYERSISRRIPTSTARRLVREGFRIAASPRDAPRRRASAWPLVTRPTPQSSTNRRCKRQRALSIRRQRST